MEATESHLELKIFVDNVKNRVVFAEAGRDFVDILFSFLSLPMGTILRLLLKAQPEPATIGCLSTLYGSVMSLGNEHFCSDVLKDMLLHPRSSFEYHLSRLKINVDDTEVKYFICSDHPLVSCQSRMSMYKNTMCLCDNLMTTEKHRFVSYNFEAGTLKCIITEDLQVKSAAPEMVLGLLQTLGINDMTVIEERDVKLGLNECLELLKLTLLSKTPLTDLFISEKNPRNTSVPTKLSLEKKDSVDRSGEFLFVEARQDFIDFLFSLLVVPLGEMLHILDGQSCLGSIDNLYQSVLSSDAESFMFEVHKNILLRPKLPPHFNRRNHLFPLESTQVVCQIDSMLRSMPVDSTLFGVGSDGGFLRKKAVLYVFDNLMFTPFSTANAINIYKTIDTPLSDLEERTLSIGMEEGISFLRAALNSPSCAFTDGLLCNNLIFKKPKQEK